MATIAVFIALGGGAYAATHLKKNSVGTKQLKKNAVTGAKVKDRSLTSADLKAGTIPTPTQTTSGPTSPEGWHEVGAPGEPQFQNGWKNSGGSGTTVAFYKDQEGVVHLRGSAGGSGGTIMFQLPPGYRPAAGKILALVIYCECIEALNVIGPTGELPAEYQGAVIPPKNLDSFDGVSFPAES